MRSFEALPDGYRKIYSIDLQTDTKSALLVNVLAIVIGVLFAVPVHFAVPFTAVFEGEDIFRAIRLISLILLLVLYMVLHELVHGIAMRLCGTKKIKYGFTGMYAFAGSSDYYKKGPYIFIALAPVVLWGIVLALILPFVPRDWFWVVYILQLTNLSGAAGDLLVTVKFSRLPKDILIRDHGVGMDVYSAL